MISLWKFDFYTSSFHVWLWPRSESGEISSERDCWWDCWLDIIEGKFWREIIDEIDLRESKSVEIVIESVEIFYGIPWFIFPLTIIQTTWLISALHKPFLILSPIKSKSFLFVIVCCRWERWKHPLAWIWRVVSQGTKRKDW